MKDAFYFPHDSNANSDPKMMMLIEQLGLEGYGIYWVLIEILRDQPDFRYPIKLLSALARRFNTTSEKMKAVVLGYGLFKVDEHDFFLSESLTRRMSIVNEKREKLSEAGRLGNEIRWRNKQLSPPDNHPITEPSQPNRNKRKEKESKLKESKEKERVFSPPSLSEVEAYFLEKGYTREAAKKAYDYYDVNNWVDGKDNKVKNWKQKMIRVWFRDENKQPVKTNNIPQLDRHQADQIAAMANLTINTL